MVCQHPFRVAQPFDSHVLLGVRNQLHKTHQTDLLVLVLRRPNPHTVEAVRALRAGTLPQGVIDRRAPPTLAFLLK